MNQVMHRAGSRHAIGAAAGITSAKVEDSLFGLITIQTPEEVPGRSP
jgi:hypothetical protein